MIIDRKANLPLHFLGVAAAAVVLPAHEQAGWHEVEKQSLHPQVFAVVGHSSATHREPAWLPDESSALIMKLGMNTVAPFAPE